MDIRNEGYFDNCGDEVSEFMFSDLELGIIQNELGEAKTGGGTELIVFNRLEMILEINNILYLN